MSAICLGFNSVGKYLLKSMYYYNHSDNKRNIISLNYVPVPKTFFTEETELLKRAEAFLP